MQATEFDCNKPANAMETMLCQDEGLIRLGNRLDKVFTQAMDKARQTTAGALSVSKLQQEQRHWVHNLKDCMKNENPHMCLGDTYILRITELQASWELAPSLTRCIICAAVAAITTCWPPFTVPNLLPRGWYAARARPSCTSRNW
jgi:uncharacterized protein